MKKILLIFGSIMVIGLGFFSGLYMRYWLGNMRLNQEPLVVRNFKDGTVIKYDIKSGHTNIAQPQNDSEEDIVMTAQECTIQYYSPSFLASVSIAPDDSWMAAVNNIALFDLNNDYILDMKVDMTDVKHPQSYIFSEGIWHKTIDNEVSFDKMTLESGKVYEFNGNNWAPTKDLNKEQ